MSGPTPTTEPHQRTATLLPNLETMKRNTTHTSPLLPFARSYWVMPGQLMGGFYPGDRDPAVSAAKLDALLGCGVTHIINLMELMEGDHAGRPFVGYKDTFHELAANRGLRAVWMQKPIRDLSVPTIGQMVNILDAIDSALAAGGCVYVHCWGGKGRTGTVMGCWLARHGERDPLHRLRTLTSHARDHFPCVPETARQQAFVSQWRNGQ